LLAGLVGERRVLAEGEPLALSPKVTEAVKISNTFGFDLYERLERGRGNVMMSPASAAIVVAMVAAGARGQTRDEMLHVLHIERERWSSAPSSFSALLGALNDGKGREGLELHVTGRLWSQQGFPFNEAVLQRLREDYGAPLGALDFQGAPREARLVINRWAARETHGRVAEVLGPRDLDELTRLVVTNAVYFKGRWLHRFSPQRTSRMAFAAAQGPRRVPTMQQVAAFRYADVENAALLELPYRGGVSMMVVLPHERSGLEAVESELAAKYEAWRVALSPRRVDVRLPRWKLATNLSLGESLSALGMPTAFKPTADFSDLVTQPVAPLALKRVLQQTFISVDETGTEAAAVTVAEIGLMGKIQVAPVPFHADHPFLYVLVEQQTGAVLFIGRVTDPSTN
jgi:serpin B